MDEKVAKEVQHVNGARVKIGILLVLGGLLLVIILSWPYVARFLKDQNRDIAHAIAHDEPANSNYLLEKRPRTFSNSNDNIDERHVVTAIAEFTPSPALTADDSSFALVAGTFINGIGMKLIRIQPGSFMRGSPPSERGRDKDERQHRVTISASFYLLITEVTQGQWQSLMGTNPSFFADCGGECPVENVNLHDVSLFLDKLNALLVDEGYTYRLPTEAEWEYACRAGSSAPFCFGHDESMLTYYAWYSHNSEKKTHPVGTKKPNSWGIHDMHGNVWEWCSDWYGEYPHGEQRDPRGPESGTYRVIRGGAWNFPAIDTRAAYRNGAGMSRRRSGVGFRLVAVHLSPLSSSHDDVDQSLD